MTNQQEQVEQVSPPDPYDIALAAMQGLLANPNYGQNPAAAAYTAWQLVPAFFEGAAQFAKMQEAAWAAHDQIVQQQQAQQGA